MPLFENREGIMAFQRTYKNERTIVLINISNELQEVRMDTEGYTTLYVKGVNPANATLWLAPFSYYIAMDKTN